MAHFSKEAGAALAIGSVYLAMWSYMLFMYLTHRYKWPSRFTILFVHTTIRVASQACGVAFGILAFENTDVFVAYLIREWLCRRCPSRADSCLCCKSRRRGLFLADRRLVLLPEGISPQALPTVLPRSSQIRQRGKVAALLRKSLFHTVIRTLAVLARQLDFYRRCSPYSRKCDHYHWRIVPR